MPVKLLIQHNYSLSPRLAAKLSCSCFHGRPGKNIPVDLHMEHLNKIAKGAIRLSMQRFGLTMQEAYQGLTKMKIRLRELVVLLELFPLH